MCPLCINKPGPRRASAVLTNALVACFGRRFLVDDPRDRLGAFLRRRVGLGGECGVAILLIGGFCKVLRCNELIRIF